MLRRGASTLLAAALSRPALEGVATGAFAPAAIAGCNAAVRAFHASSAVAAAGSASGQRVLPPPTLHYADLRDNPGAKKRQRRKGRGVGSGHGLARSAGLGTRGQKSHQDGLSLTFEGGQSPLWRRTPKFGQMHKRFRQEMEPLNLDRLQLWIDSGRIDASAPVTLKTLLDSGCVSHIKHGVKLLGDGADKFAARGVQLEVTQASRSAIAAVEAAGGSVTSVYRTRLSLHAHLHPERYDIPIRSPRPPPRKMAYYTDYRTRGYLSSKLQLERLKARIKAAQGSGAAAGAAAGEGAGAPPSMLLPVFTGGAPPNPETIELDIDIAPWRSAKAGAAAGAKQA